MKLYITILIFAVSLPLSCLPGAAQEIDRSWSMGSHWDDGKAEIAFYRIERTRDQYGRAKTQEILAGTYLVKQSFDTTEQSKASRGGVPSFKAALFYEFESGAYQYKRSWVGNAAQQDLRPLKVSYNQFDWCSNLYEEFAFSGDQVTSLKRSDDYGNTETTFPADPNAHPAALLPLLVRGLDFSSSPTQLFALLLADGRTVSVEATLTGTETVETGHGKRDAEVIQVRYGDGAPSVIAERADATETYYRGTDEHRLLLALEAKNYRMTLVESLRSAYWREDFFPRLQRIRERP